MPIFVDVKPAPWALVKECYMNVRRKVDEDGGKIVFGWAIWLHGQWFIEGEHHAVWEGPDRKFLDVTPHSPKTNRIAFLRDDAAPFDFETKKQRDNHRKVLKNDPRLDLMLPLFAERFALFNLVERVDGKIALQGALLKRFEEIENAVAQLCAQIRERPL